MPARERHDVAAETIHEAGRIEIQQQADANAAHAKTGAQLHLVHRKNRRNRLERLREIEWAILTAGAVGTRMDIALLGLRAPSTSFGWHRRAGLFPHVTVASRWPSVCIGVHRWFHCLLLNFGKPRREVQRIAK